MRFGLDGNEPMTLEQVGAYFGLTRERVRQIEARALKRLKNSRATKDLCAYIRDNDSSSTTVTQENQNNEKPKQESRLDVVDYDYREFKEVVADLPTDVIKYFIECKLKPMEIRILKLSLGLSGQEEMSAAEIANIVKKSSAFVNGRIYEALTKLKDTEHRDSFTSYLKTVQDERNKVKAKIKQ
jgi:DNA-directed RNA polymerase sigma subunit (sigma70/sigma32)